jgi:hypothetical protein
MEKDFDHRDGIEKATGTMDEAARTAINFRRALLPTAPRRPHATGQLRSVGRLALWARRILSVVADGREMLKETCGIALWFVRNEHLQQPP